MSKNCNKDSDAKDKAIVGLKANILQVEIQYTQVNYRFACELCIIALNVFNINGLLNQ